MNTSQFKIYNASAGSGKTFTLVKEYLKLLFKSTNKEHFKYILAVTFTNKAAGEMKERIIDTLKQFSSVDIITKPNSIFNAICEELPIQPNLLHQKSKNILQTIIHNYAAFDISTIDGFTHKVIRTFAYDLKLPLNFEVELDTNLLLNEAVDNLIAKAGSNKALTNILIDFAIEKADDDKSWDISYDLNKIAKLLVNENDIPFIKTFEDKTLDDFKSLKANLMSLIVTSEKQITDIANQTLQLISESGLEYSDFTRGTLPNHFLKASKLELDKLYENKLQENLTERKSIYNKSLSADLAEIIEAILPEIETNYTNLKKHIFKLKFLKAFYKNCTPLSVLNAVNKELKNIKEEQNKLLISEFNSLISNEIKDQPTPFIYERIGEKFRHYFIDEFQDTSKLQWENLSPLIDNALSSTNGSAMLVGDAKQAIYRWRGGEAEQFIDLFNETLQPFQAKQQIITLETNYRSSKEVIAFNNRFFEFVSKNVFSDATHNLLFEKAKQHSFNEAEGFVSLSFVDPEKEDDPDFLYASKVLETIQECQQTGYKLSDVCILVRKKKHGFALAEYLSDHAIKIISSETLLIQRSPEVMFINNVLSLLVKPANLEIKAAILNYIADTFKVADKHAYFSKHISLNLSQLFASFNTFNVAINYQDLVQSSLYDLVENIVRAFRLINGSNAYIQFYLDFVLDYSQKSRADISGFLEHFNAKKQTLSIVSPEGQDAVKIMTIHKSKGLEFPVVIFPYADLNIYNEIEPKEWLKIDPEKYAGFSHTLLDYSKSFLNYTEEAAAIYHKHQSELELDSLNLLYVALTRPIEQLYVISRKELDKKGEANPKKYSGLFINYLKEQNLWSDTQLQYNFGVKNCLLKDDNSSSQIEEQQFITTNIKEHTLKIVTKSALLWDTKQEKAIEKGNLLHNLLGGIKTENDIAFVLDDFIKSNSINTNQAKELQLVLKTIVNHPLLKMYFDDELTIFNEREIITGNGEIFIPDRIVINSKNEAVIIDYKTGAENEKHKTQLETYQKLIENMAIKVIKKILVYVNDEIEIKEF